MDVQYDNRMLDFLEELNSRGMTINQVFEMEDTIRQQNRKIQRLEFTLDLRDSLLEALSNENLQLFSELNKG